ncbi:sulfotransferase family protein [Marinoscillum sp.]|uniref:sulfotransferase family protein n=1 Tax=Marinoscillum sp. TaxID=2024838 RepID=UPI003BA9CB7D
MRRIKLARTLQRISDFLPRKYPVKSKTGLAEQPFFVLGSGRNGSTLLNRMLNQHSGLFLPSEQYFLGNSIIKYKLYNFLIWRDLMKVIAGELMPVTGSHTWDFGAEEIFVELNGANDKSLQNVLDAIFRTYGLKNKVAFSQWGDTTPLNTYYIPELVSVFPKARFIFLLRDGRDVVASYKRGGEAYLGKLAEPQQAAIHWVHAVKEYQKLQKQTEVLLIRYEDLVTQPEVELMKVCDHLGVAYEPNILSYHHRAPTAPMYQEPQHAKILKPVDASSIGSWKDDLSTHDLQGCTIMNSLLSKFDYQ